MSLTLACMGLGLIGLAPWMPRPHVDPDFHENGTSLIFAMATLKFVSFYWFVCGTQPCFNGGLFGGTTRFSFEEFGP